MADDALLKLASSVGAALKQRSWTLTLAESCTGGGVAHAVTAIAGSSAWFERGFVTYGNDAKMELLGVSAATLEKFGAVSEQVALEMAQGALSRSHAQISIAVSGIAGPDGGTAEKPVGMVCFALATAEGKSRSETCRFDGDRTEVRRKSVEHALHAALEGAASS